MLEERSAKLAIAIGTLALAGLGFGLAREVLSDRRATVYVYIEAEVRRVDLDGGRLVVVQEGGEELTLSAEGAALAGLPLLRPGVRAVLSCRARRDDPSTPEAVLDVRVTSRREPADFWMGAKAPSEEETGERLRSVRVVTVDRGARVLGVVDEEGTRYVLAVRQEAADALRSVRAGDQVALTLGPGKGPAGGLNLTIVGIERLSKEARR